MSSGSTRDLVLMSLFAAVTAALGLIPEIPLPMGGVPITAQTLGVMLAGAILGARRGAGSMALFVVLVALGLPLLAGGRGGLGVFAGPSGGFVIGWIFGAWITGLLVEKLPQRMRHWRFVVATVGGGIGGVYALGIPYWAAITGSSLWSVAVISAYFVPGDLIKAVIAASVAAAVQRGYPVARGD